MSHVNNKASEMWTYHDFSKNELPMYGWKIHVSTRVKSYEQVREIIHNYCQKNSVSYKHAKDIDTAIQLNSDHCTRESFGKVFTIYPDNKNVFKVIYNDLFHKLEQFDGPSILSDTKFDSKSIVHYRYGGFKKSNYFNFHDGIKEENIFKIAENKYFVDERKPYFLPPSFDENPFKIARKKTSLTLNNRYKPIKALYFSGKGGVYRCFDHMQEKEVCVKECRPWTGETLDSEDSRKWHKAEYEMYKAVEKMNIAPKVFEYFEQDGHSFFSMELWQGSNLTSYILDKNRILTVEEKADLVENIITLIISINENGLKHNDLSPNNIFVKKDGSIGLIDMEHLHKDGTKTKSGRTPGFCNENSDIDYSLAMLIYFIFTESIPVILNSGEAEEKRFAQMSWVLNQTDIPNKYKVMVLPFLQESSEIKSTKELILDLNINLLSKINMDKRRIWETSLFGDKTHISSLQHGDMGVLSVLDLSEISKDVLNSIYSKTNLLLLKDKSSNGLFFGKLGIYLQLIRLSEYLENGEQDNIIEKILSLDTDIKILDYFHGKAGLLDQLSKLYKRYPKKKILEKIKYLQNDLLTRRLNEGKTSWRNEEIINSSFSNYSGYGFAHGDAGIVYALLNSHLVWPIENMKEISLEVLKRLQRNIIHVGNLSNICHSPEDSTIWTHWCNGSSGVSQVYLKHKEVFVDDSFDEAILSLLRSSMHKVFSKGLSLCHGLAGDLISAKKAARLFNHESVNSWAMYIEKVICAKYLDEGKFIDSTGDYMVDDKGTGVAGILYALKY